MSESTRRILISCLAIAIVLCLCLSALAAAGVGLYLFTYESGQLPSPELPLPSPRETQVSPQVSPAPTEQPGESTPETDLQPGETAPSRAPVPAGVVVQMDEIEQQVSGLRGLESMGSISRFLMTPEELKQYVINDYFEDVTQEDLRDDVIELAAFGLLDPDFDFYNLLIDLFSEQISGFYDDEEKAMYVIQGSDFGGTERLTYAHEFVHALQDQHYDLKEGLGYSDERCKEDSERCAAVLALVEGDASYTQIEWFLNHATRQDQRDYLENLENSSTPVFDQAPSFLQEDFLFPYLQGLEFVTYLYDQGGWEAVNNAYREVPVSTEQILHPERYPEDSPVAVELPDLTTLLGQGWRELSRNVMGEFYTYLVLAHGDNVQARLPELDARDAAAGWGGDTYLVYHNDDTGETVMAMKTVWDTAADAQEFSQAFQIYAAARFGQSASHDGSFLVWGGSEGVNLLSISEQETVWVSAPEREMAVNLLSEMVNLP